MFEGKFQAIKEAVEKELSCSAHDLDHVMRVYNLCLYLARNEAGVNGAGVDVDIEVLKAAALLHDIARVREDRDGSGSIDHAVLGARMAEEILVDMDYPGEKVEQVKHCIRSHRFRGGNEPQTIEAKILFDADKLDAMGAVGVARFFMVAGEYGEKLYSDVSIDEYIKENMVGGTANGRIKEMSKHAPNLEFEIKWKSGPDRLYTSKGKEIARKRIGFMELFFQKLKKEVDGEI